MRCTLKSNVSEAFGTDFENPADILGAADACVVQIHFVMGDLKEKTDERIIVGCVMASHGRTYLHWGFGCRDGAKKRCSISSKGELELARAVLVHNRQKWPQ